MSQYQSYSQRTQGSASGQGAQSRGVPTGPTIQGTTPAVSNITSNIGS